MKPEEITSTPSVEDTEPSTTYNPIIVPMSMDDESRRFVRLATTCYVFLFSLFFGTILANMLSAIFSTEGGLLALGLPWPVYIGVGSLASVTILTLSIASISYLAKSHSRGGPKVIAIVSTVLMGILLPGVAFFLIGLYIG